MISWIVIMLLFWHYQKLSQLKPGKKIFRGMGVKISYNILTLLDIFTPSNNQWQSFVCVSYLLDNIYHYIKIKLMISCIVILLLSWHYQKLSQLDLGVKISYDILTDSPQVINDKVLFVVHICLIRSIKILTSLMLFWVVLMLLIFTLPKTIPTWPGGQNIVWYFDPPLLIINDKVLFAFHIYLRRCIIISKSC